MIVPFKKLNPVAVTPCYAKNGDAGMDLTATRVIHEDEKQITYGTDLAFEIPDGFVGLVFPRSSIRKYDLDLSNSVGVIDSQYRGEIEATFNKKIGMASSVYNIGDRICQIIIMPFPFITLKELSELNQTDRGENGFGSTGE